MGDDIYFIYPELLCIIEVNFLASINYRLQMVKLTTLGYPRIGSNRELKKAVEKYWKGNISESELKQEANQIKLYKYKKTKDFIDRASLLGCYLMLVLARELLQLMNKLLHGSPDFLGWLNS